MAPSTAVTPVIPATAAKKAGAPKTVKPATASKAIKAAPKSAVKSAVKSAAKSAPKSASPVTKTAKPKAPTVAPKVAPTAAPKNSASPAKPAKEKKVKVVRDSFTLPKTELLQIADMKKRAMALGVEVKKSELIRAGLQALSTMTDAPFKKALGNVPTIKTGRPAKA
jgi:hypothetical protein